MTHATRVTTPVTISARPQPYRFIHKGLRALMLRTLTQMATLDARRDDERGDMVAAVTELLQFCSDHLQHENAFFHAPLRARAPRAVLPFDDDHEGHEIAIGQLQAQLAQLAGGGALATTHAHSLYLALSRFVGENLEHMAEEETTLTEALWAHFSDAEILAMGEALRASLSAQEAAYALRWIARGLNDEEVGELLGKAQGELSPAAYTGLLAMVSHELSAERRQRLPAGLLSRAA